MALLQYHTYIKSYLGGTCGSHSLSLTGTFLQANGYANIRFVKY